MLKLKTVAIAFCILLLVAGLNLVRGANRVLAQSSCDASYPDVCIAPAPPDLDCGDIEYRNFRVTGNDPHRFDGDKDGVGCES